jgi:hypothetical protein
MLKRTLLLLSLSLACSNIVLSKPIDQQYSGWDALTKKHVHWLADQTQSRTDYAGLKKDHAQLKQVLAELSAVTQAEFDQLSQDQQKAFLINAYNAYTVELILSKYPNLKSIKELGSFLQSPWKKEFFTLLGKERNLDWIENDMLRASYKDPRIHVGINCASIGCPALRDEAYTSAKVDAQLEDGMRRFLSDKTRNRYRDGKLEVSEIFKWFSEDFEKGNKGFKHVNDVFVRYAAQLSSEASVQAKIRSKVVPLSYLPYDWTLNDSAHGAQ